jgi:hypothetical protein
MPSAGRFSSRVASRLAIASPTGLHSDQKIASPEQVIINAKGSVITELTLCASSQLRTGALPVKKMAKAASRGSGRPRCAATHALAKVFVHGNVLAGKMDGRK